jgi:hypothetical protein
MKRENKKIDLDILKPLFWEYDWGSVKENLTSPFVIARILELGNPEQFRLFAELVGNEIIKKFLYKKGKKLLSPQSFNFWRLYYQKNETTK